MKKENLIKSLLSFFMTVTIGIVISGCDTTAGEPKVPNTETETREQITKENTVTPNSDNSQTEVEKQQPTPAEINSTENQTSQTPTVPEQAPQTPSENNKPNIEPTPTPAPEPAPTPAPQPNPPSSTKEGITYWAEVEDYILKMVNEERGKNGKGPLALNSTMRGFARDKSKEMIELNYFSHNSPRNGYIGDILSKNGIKYKNVGENIAMQQGGETISSYDMAKKFMDMWMNSSGHRANILNGDYTNLGVGVAKSGTLLEATQVFFTPM